MTVPIQDGLCTTRDFINQIDTTRSTGVEYITGQTANGKSILSLYLSAEKPMAAAISMIFTGQDPLSLSEVNVRF